MPPVKLAFQYVLDKVTVLREVEESPRMIALLFEIQNVFLHFLRLKERRVI
jgi:hypothetical protein